MTIKTKDTGSMSLKSLILAGAMLFGTVLPAAAAGSQTPPKDVSFSFEGPFGTFDRAALQRGFQVYKEVCSSCHSMNLLKYRNLGDAGGPGFSEAEVKAIAAQYQVADGPNDDGEMFERAGLPKDKFRAPFPNEQAAKAANNGALPPDLSLMAKARANGPAYLYSLLTGYQDAPADQKIPAGLTYNPYFPGGLIAMAAPLNEGQVTYADGTPATVSNMAKDVTTFLMWAAEPKMEERKKLGFMVVLYMLVLTGLLFVSYKKLWRDVPH